MRNLLFVLGVFSVSGCPKALPPPPIWETVPRLPAPKAGSYNQSKEAPPDPAVAVVAHGKAWDASLSGAAAGLALDLIQTTTAHKLTRWGVREAAWSAGYPYPIDDAKAWSAADDGSPPPDLLTWVSAFGPEDDLGLVRARGQDGDLWVALKAHPTIDLGRIPRQLGQGGQLELPAVPGASYAIANADGHLLVGSLEEPQTIDTPSRGEWLVRVIHDGKTAALFPVYVGLVPPEQPLIDAVVPVMTDVDAINRVQAMLLDIRGAYGVEGIQRDFMLDSGARSLLSGGSSTRDGVTSSLGLDATRTAVWECSGGTVEVCLDRMVWSPSSRRALFDPDTRLGVAARVDAKGLRLVGILSPVVP